MSEYNNNGNGQNADQNIVQNNVFDSNNQNRAPEAQEPDLYSSFYRQENKQPASGSLEYSPSGDYRYYEGGWQPRKPRRGLGWMVATIVLAAFIAGGLLVYYLPPFSARSAAQSRQTAMAAAQTPAPTVQSHARTPNPQATVPAIGGAALALGSNYDIPAIVDADSPAVVGVINSMSDKNAFGYNLQGQAELQSSGSGVIIKSDAADGWSYIVTNNHVVAGADSLTVVMPGGEQVEAKLVGADEQTDIAVIKIQKTGLAVIPIGDSDTVRVGQTVLAIGNPLGTELAGTVTAGIISAKNRVIQNGGYTFNLLQTDAAINPGNSGGALVDMQGDLIGINQMKITTSEVDEYGNAISAEGIGFAIPINDTLPIIQQLMENGFIPRPMLGIDMSEEVTQRIAQLNRIPVGIYLEQLTSGGPADQAGILRGDILTKLDGTATPTLADMNAVLSKHSIGDTVKAEVWRGGITMTFEVTLEGQQTSK